jgi:hypothetical protein
MGLSWGQPKGGAQAMGQLLLMLVVPPIVGVVTYAVIRIFQKDNKGGAPINERAHDPSARIS